MFCAAPAEVLVERGRWVFEHLPSRVERLLDVGCHDGAITSVLESHVNSAMAIDVDLSAVHAGRQLYPKVRFAAASAGALPFATGTFDCVVFSEVLEHVPAAMERECIAELHRVLRPDGTLLFTTPHRGTFWWLDPLMLKTHARRLAGRLSGSRRDLKGHKHYTVKELRDLLARYFDVDRVDRRGWLLYPLGYWGHLATSGRLPTTGPLWRGMMDVDYSREYGDAAYNICIVAHPRSAEGR